MLLQGTTRSAMPWRNRVGGWAAGSVCGSSQRAPTQVAQDADWMASALKRPGKDKAMRLVL